MKSPYILYYAPPSAKDTCVGYGERVLRIGGKNVDPDLHAGGSRVSEAAAVIEQQLLVADLDMEATEAASFESTSRR